MAKFLVDADSLGAGDVILPAEEDRSPEMLELTDLQAKFVVAMVITGAQNYAECARLAGYGNGSAEQQRVRGSELARNPKVIAALRVEADRRLQAGALIGASVMMEIALDAGHKDRLKAAEGLLNRGGLALVQKHEHMITDNRSAKQLEEYIIGMARIHGMDPQKLLGYQPAVPSAKVGAVDAEFVEVTDDLADLMGGGDEE